jgi:hypothetical protein
LTTFSPPSCSLSTLYCTPTTLPFSSSSLLTTPTTTVTLGSSSIFFRSSCTNLHAHAIAEKDKGQGSAHFTLA